LPLPEKGAHHDRELRVLDRTGGVLWCDGDAPLAEQLAEAPAPEALGIADEPTLLRKVKSLELFEKGWRLRAGLREFDIERAEVQIERPGAIEIEDIATDLVTGGTDLEEMEQKQVFVFVCRPAFEKPPERFVRQVRLRHT
jgi:hypothetical protein